MKSRVPRETGTSGGIAERSFLDSDVCVDEREEPTRERERERRQTRHDNLTSYDAGELHLRRLESAGLTLRSDIGITRNTRKLSLARRYLRVRVLLHRDIIDGIIRANVRLLGMPDFEAIISNCRGSRSQRSLQAEKQAGLAFDSSLLLLLR